MRLQSVDDESCEPAGSAFPFGIVGVVGAPDTRAGSQEILGVDVVAQRTITGSSRKDRRQSVGRLYALDPDNAQRLWDTSERLAGSR